MNDATRKSDRVYLSQIRVRHIVLTVLLFAVSFAVLTGIGQFLDYSRQERLFVGYSAFVACGSASYWTLAILRRRSTVSAGQYLASVRVLARNGKVEKFAVTAVLGTGLAMAVLSLFLLVQPLNASSQAYRLWVMANVMSLASGVQFGLGLTMTVCGVPGHAELFENGIMTASPDTCRAIARLAGCPFDSIFRAQAEYDDGAARQVYNRRSLLRDL